jgi:hypothetical protein
LRLPRWLVVSLLAASVLAVLGYGAWWWVTWPERTGREHFELLQQGRFAVAAKMLNPPASYVETIEHESDNEHMAPGEYWQLAMKTAKFEGGLKRTVLDIILGRQDVLMTHEAGPEPFRVERGAVVWPQYEEAWCRGHNDARRR